jgi:hypothetical protein
VTAYAEQRRLSPCYAHRILLVSWNNVERSDIVEALCRIPLDFRERGDVSVATLLEQSGYVHTQVELDDIAQHVRAHPDLVAIWLRFSADQRSTPSWYLLSPGETFRGVRGWAVGIYPGAPPTRFDDEVAACAFFVRQWAEQVRGHVGGSS